jgi:glycosyltransferase involved in cell wall biosynthesis
MILSVIIPAYNAASTLPALLDSLSNQAYKDYEIIVVDDCSTDSTPDVVKSYNCDFVRLEENRGPAVCRNIGVGRSKGDILVFTDSDCRVDKKWLSNIYNHFENSDISAIMGRLVLLPSTLIGDSISAIGFPAGGAIGFDKIWRVDTDGYTDSLSTCNCAVKKDVFFKVGGFDETFPFPGGEDSFLAYNLRTSNLLIKYCPNVLAYHEARKSLHDFIKWQFHRGISSFIFSQKVSRKGDFLSLRIWSTKNIIKCSITDKKLPLVLFLLGISFFVQLAGYLFAKYNKAYY